MIYNVLLADDDASIRFVLSKYLTKVGYKVRATDNAQTLMKWIKSGEGDVVLTDVYMESDDIFTFIPELARLRPDLPIIVMSANTSVATALQSGSLGVFDYIPKPFDLDVLSQTLTRALKETMPKNARKTVVNKHLVNTEPMVGKSAVMQPVFRGISDYMSADIPVFIYGDIGTGKNHAAKLLHEAGRRAREPFVDFYDCETLILLEEAVLTGDVFVDRIHELPKDKQSLLLRILEKNEHRKTKEKFRVISMSSKSPREIENDGTLRLDLFFHLRGAEIALPPLAQRSGDISELAHMFLNLGKKSKHQTISLEAMKLLEGYHWPGNVRELKTLMQTLALRFSDGHISGEIMRSIMSPLIGFGDGVENADYVLEDIHSVCEALLQASMDAPEGQNISPYIQALAWVEKPLIEAALRMTGGNNIRAAELLGIHRNTLRTKIKALKIPKLL